MLAETLGMKVINYYLVTKIPLGRRARYGGQGSRGSGSEELPDIPALNDRVGHLARPAPATGPRKAGRRGA